jgi:hypothetical protein
MNQKIKEKKNQRKKIQRNGELKKPKKPKKTKKHKILKSFKHKY